MKKSIFAIAIIASTLFAGQSTTVSAATVSAASHITQPTTARYAYDLPVFGITKSPQITIDGYANEYQPVINGAGEVIASVKANEKLDTRGEWIINGVDCYVIDNDMYVPRALTNMSALREYAVKF